MPEPSSLKTREQAITESKFLGGDIQHTHLVKGLDFALLQKTRTELEHKTTGPELDQNSEEDEVEQKFYQTLHIEPISEPAVSTAEGGEGRNLAKRIVDILNNNIPTRQVELFLPNRAAFLFDVDPDVDSELPTTLIRSKADLQAVPEEDVSANKIDLLIFSRISKIMDMVRESREMRKETAKKKRKLIEEASAAAAQKTGNKPKGADDSDDDIFAGVGDEYELEIRPEQQQRLAAAKNISYFGKAPPSSAAAGSEQAGNQSQHPPAGQAAEPKARALADLEEEGQIDDDMDLGDNMDIDEPAPGPSAGPSAFAQMQPLAGYPPLEGFQYSAEAFPAAPGFAAPGPPAKRRDTGAAKVSNTVQPINRALLREPAAAPVKPKPTDSREKEAGFVPDYYSEAYPAAFEASKFNDTLYDSDEEADLTKMDMGGNKKGTLRRWDFPDEAAWERYNASREATPKAAFQFGVKAGDGRKTRKNTKQKTNEQLKKINKIILDKYGTAIDDDKPPAGEKQKEEYEEKSSHMKSRLKL